MSTARRPLSPHLQVYKPQLTSVLSISHRATGILLSVGALLLCFLLLAVAKGEATYAVFLNHLHAWYGRAGILLFLFALFYHLCNGVRHLFWDAGLGLEIETTYKSGYTVLVVSLLLSLAVSIYGGLL